MTLPKAFLQYAGRHTAPLDIPALLRQSPAQQSRTLAGRLLATLLAVDPKGRQLEVDVSTSMLWATEALVIQALHLDMSEATAAEDRDAEMLTVQEALDDAFQRGGRLWKGTRWLSLQVIQATPWLLLRSDTPVAQAIWEVSSAMLSAFHRHGHYDPTTNHQPPPGHALDAIEHRERGRDLWNDLMPGMGDLMAGKPLTERPPRGRFGRIVTTEAGEKEWLDEHDLWVDPAEEEDL